MIPKISVIVTTYNRSELLKETVISILLQTFTNFELIIIDNHSNYNFFELIETFKDGRIRAFQNTNNGIIAINRNYGIKLAIGEYIALCDDDDLWEPTKLEEQMRVMKKYSSVALSCTDISVINFIGKKTMIRSALGFIKKKALSFNIIPAKYLLISFSFITNSSVLFKRSLVNSIGYINEDPDLRTIEDYEFWFRLAQNNRVYYINKKLVRYRLHEHQSSLVDSNVYSRTSKVVKDYLSKLNTWQKLIFKLQESLIK